MELRLNEIITSVAIAIPTAVAVGGISSIVNKYVSRHFDHERTIATQQSARAASLQCYTGMALFTAAISCAIAILTAAAASAVGGILACAFTIVAANYLIYRAASRDAAT